MSPWPRRMITVTFNALSNKATSRAFGHDTSSTTTATPPRSFPWLRHASSSSPDDEHTGAGGRPREARPVWAEIELDTITHNVALIRTNAGRKVKLLMPVKANAYGHGVVEVSRHLERLGVDGLATANVDEPWPRAAGVTLPILLYGAQLPAGNSFRHRDWLTPTIYDHLGLPAVAAAARPGKPIKVHVKVDAGMGRLGVRIDECAAFVRDVLATPGVHLEGMYTHIPFSNDAGEAWSRRRLQAFAEVVRMVEIEHGITIEFAQAAASSVFSRGVPDGLNTISPGHLTFGLHPIAAPVLRRSASARRFVHFGLSSSTSDGGAWVTIFPAPVRAGWITMQRSA